MAEDGDEAGHDVRSGLAGGERGAALRPLPRGLRGGRHLQALAREDRHRGGRPPVLPDHDEPPPAAHQRRVRGAVPAGPQRRRRPARLLARARHVGRRHLRQGDREPGDRGADAPAPVFHGDTLYAESKVLEVRPSESSPTGASSGCERTSTTRKTSWSRPSSARCWFPARPGLTEAGHAAATAVDSGRIPAFTRQSGVGPT